MTRYGGQIVFLTCAVIGLYKGSCMSGRGIGETWRLGENAGNQFEATQYAKNQLAAGILQIEKKIQWNIPNKLECQLLQLDIVRVPLLQNYAGKDGY